MTELTENKVKKTVLGWVSVMLMGLLYATSYQLFVVKNHFAPAGISGIAMMIEYKLGFSVGYFNLIINIPLTVLAFFLINKEFALKSFVFTVFYSGFYILLSKLNIEHIQYDAGNVDTIFPCMLAGIMTGIATGVTFRVNGSTGGVDIIAKYLSKVRPFLNFFAATFVLNAIVAIASFFVYAEPNPEGGLIYSYKPVCLCVLYSFIAGFVGNYICKGTRTACNFMIVTNRPREIEKEIMEKLHHGVTEIDAVGAYSRNESSLLICVVNRHQIVELRNLISKHEDTFGFVYTVDETIGKFDRSKKTIIPLNIASKIKTKTTHVLPPEIKNNNDMENKEEE